MQSAICFSGATDASRKQLELDLQQLVQPKIKQKNKTFKQAVGITLKI